MSTREFETNALWNCQEVAGMSRWGTFMKPIIKVAAGMMVLLKSCGFAQDNISGLVTLRCCGGDLPWAVREGGGGQGGGRGNMVTRTDAP